jgi:hemerythrin-like domain-containing protein
MTDGRPTSPLVELASQHATLRLMMDRCEELADAFDAGEAGPTQLLREVAKLRIAFDAHNQFEEHLLGPMLLELGQVGSVRVSRMLSDHAAEHRSMRQHLGSNTTSELRAVLDSLRDHLESEEQYFFGTRLSHDDLVV